MLIDNVPRLLRIAFAEQKSLELIGGFGIGKTSLIRQFVDEMTNLSFTVRGRDGTVRKHEAGEPIGLRECLVPTYAVEDVRGFPMPDYEKGEMFYSIPPFFPSERVYPDGVPRFGVIFLDEYRLGPDEVVKATTQLLLERRIGDHRLDAFGHWVVFAASNREEDRVGIGKEPPIVTQRKMVVEVEPTVMAFLSWLEKNEGREGIPPVFRFCARDNPDLVMNPKTPDDGKPFCTPRTFCEAGQLIRRYMDLTGYKQTNGLDIPSQDNFAFELMASKVGESAAAQIQQYGNMIGQVPSYAEIMKDPEKAVVPQSERMDAAYVTMAVVEHNAGSWCRDKDGEQDPEKLNHEVDALFTYMMRLPPEFRVVGIRRAFDRFPEIYAHPRLRELSKMHPEIFKAIR